MNRIPGVMWLWLVAASSNHSVAQVNAYKDPTPGVSSFRAEALAEVRIQEDKFTRLAVAIPFEK